MLEGKVALVTGCSRGIGRAVAELFAQNGAVVYANARSKNSLDELEDKVIPVYFDVNDTVAVKDCFLSILKKEKRLDILVNNAGIMKDAMLGMIDQKLMVEVFQTNVFSVINMCQYAVRIMTKNQAGSIINIASILGQEGNAGQTVYSASKGAVIAMTKAMSKELCTKGIRVNAIAPGMIDTDLFRSIGEEKMEEVVQKIGMGYVGTPSDVANAALFLASDLSAYVTGQILGINGGVSL